MRDFVEEHKTLFIGVGFFAVVLLFLFSGGLKQPYVENYEKDTVVYSINDEQYTADDVYDELVNYDVQSDYSKETIAVYDLIEKAVVNSIETTDEITKNAENGYGAKVTSENREDVIYDYKKNLIIQDYCKENIDELKIRSVYMVTVGFENLNSPSETPTENEQSEINEINNYVSAGGTVDYIASHYSDDETTSANNGLVGIIDANTTSVLGSETIAKTALSLNEGQYSDWFRLDGYGYVKIYVGESSAEALETLDIDGVDGFVSLSQKYDTTITKKAIYDKAQIIGLSFTDETLKTLVELYVNNGEITDETPSYTNEHKYDDVIVALDNNRITKGDVFNEMLTLTSASRETFLKASAFNKIADKTVDSDETVADKVNTLYRRYAQKHLTEYTENKEYLYFSYLDFGDEEQNQVTFLENITGMSEDDAKASVFYSDSGDKMLLENDEGRLSSTGFMASVDLYELMKAHITEDGWLAYDYMNKYYAVKLEDSSTEEYNDKLIEFLVSDKLVQSDCVSYYLQENNVRIYS